MDQKFKVGDKVKLKSEWLTDIRVVREFFEQTGSKDVGTIIDIDHNYGIILKKYTIPWNADCLELAIPSINEAKLKKVLGL